MANSKSAIKRARQNKTRRARNRAVRSRNANVTKAFRTAAEEGNVEQAEAALQAVTVQLTKSVSKGVIPKKRASRRISRMAKRLHQLRNSAE